MLKSRVTWHNFGIQVRIGADLTLARPHYSAQACLKGGSKFGKLPGKRGFGHARSCGEAVGGTTRREAIRKAVTALLHSRLK